MAKFANGFRRAVQGVRNRLSGSGKAFDISEYDQVLYRHKRRRRRLIIAVFLLAVAAVVGFIIYNHFKVFKDYTVKEETEINNRENDQYAVFGDYLLQYNNDGISCLSGTEQIWNQAYEMKKPLMDICGSYTAVGEQKSNTVYVFDASGLQGQMEMQYPIVKLEVANQGVVAALEEDGEANYIEVRDKDGSSLITGKTVLDGNGYPIDFSLSEDGTKMVVSYLCVNGGQAETKVLFYNFSDIGKNEVDRMVGGFNHYQASIVPEVEFVNNNVAVAFGNNIFTIYSMKNKPEIVAEETFSNEVKKVLYSEDYIGLVFYNSAGEKPFELVVYDLDGKQVLSTPYEKEYDTVKLDKDTVILYDEFECRVIALNGREKFKYTFSEQIVDILPTEDAYTYYLVGATKMKRIKLK